MKTAFIKAATMATFVFGAMGGVHAATAYAHSNKYFDESGAIVGQQILLCNNFAYHAGNIHTAYKITEVTACGENPPPHYIVPETIITYYTLPGSVTIGYACVAAECEPSYAPEPERLTDKGWTWSLGWQ